MNYNLIIIAVLVINLFVLSWIIYQNYNKNKDLQVLREGFTSDEAIQNVASLYNQNKLTITDLDVTGNLNVAGNLSFLPKGIIVSWAGATPPAGWAICDGQNGTPNLTDRFVLGGPPYGQAGGAFSYTLTVAQMPTHNHNFTNTGDDNGYCSKDNQRACGLQTSDQYTNDRQTTFNTSDSGGNQPYTVTPPYYRLAYIMKL